MIFTFQESQIWEAGDPLDYERTPVRIKAKSVERARKQLPRPDLGRVWIHIPTNDAVVSNATT